MFKKTISLIGASALMLVANTLFTTPAIAAGAKAEDNEGATRTLEKIIRQMHSVSATRWQYNHK